MKNVLIPLLSMLLAALLGRMILVRGLYTDCDWDVLTTRASVSPAGDINYRTNVDANGVMLDVCITEGNPGTWDTLSLD